LQEPAAQFRRRHGGHEVFAIVQLPGGGLVHLGHEVAVLIRGHAAPLSLATAIVTPVIHGMQGNDPRWHKGASEAWYLSHKSAPVAAHAGTPSRAASCLRHMGYVRGGSPSGSAGTHGLGGDAAAFVPNRCCATSRGRTLPTVNT